MKIESCQVPKTFQGTRNASISAAGPQQSGGDSTAGIRCTVHARAVNASRRAAARACAGARGGVEHVAVCHPCHVQRRVGIRCACLQQLRIALAQRQPEQLIARKCQFQHRRIVQNVPQGIHACQEMVVPLRRVWQTLAEPCFDGRLLVVTSAHYTWRRVIAGPLPLPR